jgi:predicted nuclease of restriction endonuclease-like (RecB) superfamily
VAKPKKAPSRTTALLAPAPAEFDDVLRLIDAARGRAVAAVNKELIDLYWSIGEHISRKVAAGGWGEGTVEALAAAIRRRHPNARGFSAPNLWRMRQFYETYRDQRKLSALLRELTWTHNLFILGKCKRDEEREFYLRSNARSTVPYSSARSCHPQNSQHR